MKTSIWKGGKLDSRYAISRPTKDSVLVCHVFSGHHRDLDDELLALATSFWQNGGESPGALLVLIDELQRKSETSSGGTTTSFSAVAASMRSSSSIEISHIGSRFFSYINGRKISGGRVFSGNWKMNIFSSLELGDDGHITSCSITNFPCQVSIGDQIIIGTPFLDDYTIPAELAAMRASSKELPELLEAHGTRLEKRSEREFRSGGVYDMSDHEQHRLLVGITI